MSVDFVKAEDVDSPRLKWSLISVLDDPGEPVTLVLALGRWHGKPVLAMRWNGEKKKPLGMPQVRGHATWFVIDHQYDDALISTLTADKQRLVRAILKK